MTIGFDTAALTNDKDAGAGLDWLKGVEGMRRSDARPTDASGALLTRVIEREIIPRLFLAHRAQSTTATQPAPDAASFVEISDKDALASLVLKSEPHEILDQVNALIDRGNSLQSIYLDVLAPVARRLGEFWEEDRCTFIDVTIALSRLQRVLRELGRRNGNGFRSTPKRRVYLVPAPGEQHTFGLSMVEELFLHAGWETASDQSASADAVLQTISQGWFDIIGFSLGCEEFLGPLSDLIKEARKVSRNPDVAIIVGGRLLIDRPEFASQISATAVAFDGVNAVETAENLVAQSPRPAAIHQ